MSGDVWTLDEAKSDLDAVIQRAQSGEPQFITSGGITVAQVTKAQTETSHPDADQGKRLSFVEYLLTIPQGGDVEFERIDLPERPVEL